MSLMWRGLFVIFGLALLFVAGGLAVVRSRGESNAAWVSFISTHDGYQYVSLINPEGGSLRRISISTLGEIISMDWLPEGKWIISTVGNEIYYLHLDGRLTEYEPVQLINDSRPYFQSPSINNLIPPEREVVNFVNEDSADSLESRVILNKWVSWSLDHKWIVYASTWNGQYDIYRSQGYGTEMNRLTDDRGEDIMPSWSPDGKWITFSSNRDGGQDIYRVGVNGDNLQRLTNISGNHTYPRWSSFIDMKWNSLALILFSIGIVGVGGSFDKLLSMLLSR